MNNSNPTKQTCDKNSLIERIERMRKDIPSRMEHWKFQISRTNRRIARWKAEEYNQALDDVLKIVREEV